MPVDVLPRLHFVPPGSAARPHHDGYLTLTPVVDDLGQRLRLDRPTSLEFVGNTAYVVSVTGDVYRVEGL